jgi:hypothetical protein
MEERGRDMYCPDPCLSGLRKLQNILLQTIGVSAEARTRHLAIKSEPFRLEPIRLFFHIYSNLSPTNRHNIQRYI